MDPTPASVTRAVQSLDERVGMRLLQRTTRRLRAPSMLLPMAA
ncbi:LysR family transcriptional regulator [Variovorax sp. YR752]